MKMSKKFEERYLEQVLFKEVKLNWFNTIFYYMWDSKYKLTKKLNDIIQRDLMENLEELFDVVDENQLNQGIYETRIINILKWVHRNFDYKSDQELFSRREYWSPLREILYLRSGDCDDLNRLIHCLGLCAGIPSELLYSAIGETIIEPHYWLIFYSPKYKDKYAIDATMYPSYKSISIRDKFTLGPVYTKIWFVFNEFGIWKYR